jgi:4Fe-4S ferredoxin
VGCGICKIICPREAIEIKTVPKSTVIGVRREKAKRPIVDVDKERCSYCGMCDAICLFGAITVRVDGEHVIPVIRTESFPQLIREIEVDTMKCEVGCSDCERVCPLNLIKIRRVSSVTRARELLESKKKGTELKPLIDIKEDSCGCCRLCETRCPQEAIHIRKLFHGTIKINREKCPRGCQDCLDVCPISGAIYLSDDSKMYPNESHCVFCGVCKMVCPVEGALEVQRTFIRHTLVHSGAWNRALEKLTSTKELTKELSAKALSKARESVQRRFKLRPS